eukprot:4260554-Pyramimonas_sp.AAC.1
MRRRRRLSGRRVWASCSMGPVGALVGLPRGSGASESPFCHRSSPRRVWKTVGAPPRPRHFPAACSSRASFGLEFQLR